MTETKRENTKPITQNKTTNRDMENTDRMRNKESNIKTWTHGIKHRHTEGKQNKKKTYFKKRQRQTSTYPQRRRNGRENHMQLEKYKNKRKRGKQLGEMRKRERELKTNNTNH